MWTEAATSTSLSHAMYSYNSNTHFMIEVIPFGRFIKDLDQLVSFLHNHWEYCMNLL